MSSRQTAPLAWALWGVALLLWTVGFWVRTIGRVGADGDRVVASLAFIVLFTAGVLVASRRPDSPFGWIMLAYGLVAGVEGLAIGYALGGAGAGWPFADATAIAWFSSWIGLPGSVLPIVALLLLLDGRLPSPHWRPLVWLIVVSAVAGAAGIALAPGPLLNREPNPLGVQDAADFLVQVIGVSRWLLVIAFAAAVASLVVRFRSARGEERLQLKWVAAGAFVWVMATLAIRVNPPTLTPYLPIIHLIGLVSFGVAVTVAILRYRLYDVDFFISRTLAYGALGLCITAIYIGVVVGVGTLAHTTGEPNLVVSLVATALVAAIFQPARERVLRLANRLVYGQRSSPYEVLADFSKRVAGALSVDEVLPQMAEAAAHGVGASRARVRVYVPGSGDRAVAWPPDALAGPYERTVPVLHQGTLIGEIAVSKPDRDPLTSAENKLLTDLASQAGPAFENVRLDLELQSRLAELQASRQRIVAAQDVERRRLERDIHDGAQQELVALAINIRVAQELLYSDPAEAEGLLTELGQNAESALSTLRDLARGIYPAALVDRGLSAAVEAYVAKTCPEVQLATDGVGVNRYAPEAEAGVYFCCLEALQNRAKHAARAPGRVDLRSEDGWLTFAVSDQGPGFEPTQARAGSGLQNMADRMAALGGVLEVKSTPGHGTRVSGRVPTCALEPSQGTTTVG